MTLNPLSHQGGRKLGPSHSESYLSLTSGQDSWSRDTFLSFDDAETPRFSESARKMKIDSENFTIFYSNECPYVEHEVQELREYAASREMKIDFIKIDSLEKAKNVPCIFNNWANFYQGRFISNTIINTNALEKLLR